MKKILLILITSLCLNLNSTTTPTEGLRSYVDFLELQKLVEDMDAKTNAEWNKILKLTVEQIKYLRDENYSLKMMISSLKDANGRK